MFVQPKSFSVSQITRMSSTAEQRAQFILPDDQPLVRLEVEQAFSALTPSESLYSHYLSLAGWYGGLIVLYQTSPESPDIFRLVHSLNTAESTQALKEKALAAGVTENEFQAYMVYCSGFYANNGNYKGFGDSKFVPNLDEKAFEKIVMASQACAKNPGLKDVWSRVIGPMYSLSDREKQLGLGAKGITKYFSGNCDTKDSDIVNKYFKQQNIEGYINRVIKTEEGGVPVYEIRNAGVDKTVKSEDDFEGCKFKVTTGDYEALLEKVNENLTEAAKHASNDLEKNMIKEYIQSFKCGSLDKHKDGSRYWIQNKGPIVETYIGFIETYRDPAGMRGEFEAFVSVVNKKMSEKFQVLVDKAEELLPKLPWSSDFEKDTFLRPDFTSLDVLTFSGSGVPAGINIPNYDEIRQSEGFKNVSLGNVLAASYGVKTRSNYLSDADDQLMKEYKVGAFEVGVGLHELLGHGSGKLFQKSAEGKLNFPADIVNPLTEKPVDSWYAPGETYDSKFTTVGSSYEECRAECVALHLCLVPGVPEIFGYSGEAVDHIIYVNWLTMAHSGLKGLEMFSPTSMEWKQAHCQARFVILGVMIEAGDGFCKVEKTTGSDGKPDLLLTMDRSKLESVGAPSIAKFLTKLQVYKSTGDIANAREMFDKYSKVSDTGDHPWLLLRDIVVARKQPRAILVQGNTKLENEKIVLTQYDPTPEGMINSMRDRFPNMEELAAILDKVSETEGKHW